MLSPFELESIGECIPRLNKLSCAVDVASQPETLQRHFPLVHQLEIRMIVPLGMPDIAMCWSHIRRCMIDIDRITTLTYLAMDFHSDYRDHGELRLSPSNQAGDLFDVLLALYHRLTSLILLWDDELEVRDYHTTEWPTLELNQLRCFTHLTQLDVRQNLWSTKELSDLFAAPFTMPLTHLDLINTTITADVADSLARATEFTRFEPEKLDLPDASFMASYHRLKVCKLICTAVVNVNLLLTAMSHCRLITNLVLGHPNMSHDGLNLLLTPLTVLASLELVDMGGFTHQAQFRFGHTTPVASPAYASPDAISMPHDSGDRVRSFALAGVTEHGVPDRFAV